MKDTKDNYVTVGWLLYAITSIAVILIASITQKSGIAIIITALLGIVQSLLTVKEQRIAFLFGVVRMLLYAYILFGERIYGGAAYSLLYITPMFIYGYINWKRAKQKDNSGVKTIPLKNKNLIITVSLSFILIYAIILKNIGSNQYILDSILSVLGVLRHIFNSE